MNIIQLINSKSNTKHITH